MKKIPGKLHGFVLRLTAIRDYLKLNQTEFADALKISLSSLSKIETGRSKPGFNFFYNIIEKFNVNPTYLLLGKGTPFIDNKKKMTGHLGKLEYGRFSDKINEFYNYLEKSPQAQIAMLEYWSQYYYTHKEIIDADIIEYEKKADGIENNQSTSSIQKVVSHE